MVAAFGHLSRLGNELPSGSTPVNSSHFNESIVIHDDNAQPAELLSEKSRYKEGGSVYDYSKIESFVVPLPERVFLTAECFQKAVEQVLNDGKYAYRNISQILREKRLVLRYLLTTVRSFKRKLAERGMGHLDVEDVYRIVPMPHFIWLCEISEADLYCHEQKIWGEVVWDATRNAYEVDGWIALHYPEKLLVDLGSAMNGRQDIHEMDLTNPVEYPLYCSNLEEIP